MFDDKVVFDECLTVDEQLVIKKEFRRLRDVCYLDHTGCPAYSDSQLSNIFNELRDNVFGNPHSGSTVSKYCIDSVDQVRYKILKHFNTTPNEYSIIFTSGATAALKLVAESFVWMNQSDNENGGSSESPMFMYMEDNHTSVLGMRNVIKNKDVEIKCISQKDTISAFKNISYKQPLSSNDTNSLFVYSAQCNFSGVKYPLSWIQEVHRGILNKNITKESNWYCLLDAATFVSTNPLDLSAIKPDFVAISFYKMFGFPTGLGALLVKNSVSHLLKKTYYGGGTVFVAVAERDIFVPKSVLHEKFEDGTINFLSIISLEHGFKIYEHIASCDKISKHCFELARYTFQCMLRLHHANGSPVAILYADSDYSDIRTQGNIINFNLLRPNKEYVGYAEVMSLANLHGIQLRAGCFCNPGACRRHLNLTSEEVMAHYKAGHVCGDDNDLIEGKPTGSLRISFGLYTTLDDVIKFLNFIVTCFVMKPIIQKYPNQEPRYAELNIESCKDENKSLQPLDGRITAMNLVYFWFENVESCSYDDYSYSHPEELQSSFLNQLCLSKHKGQYSNARLGQIFIYPIKSCGRLSVDKWKISGTGLLYDRKWMITTASGVVLTQKTEHKLCLIRPLINLKDRTLILTCKGFPNFTIDIEDKKQNKSEAWLCSSKVCGDAVQGLDCGDSVSLWLSHVLGREGLRLVRQEDRTAKSGDTLSFSNQAQYLLINEASVNWLYDKLGENVDCRKESMVHRFRSNFVIEGLETPFEEQTWTAIKFGSHEFMVCGPCSRCQMICIDQDTGEKNKEPLTSLAASMKGKLKFGIYLSKAFSTEVTLSVGDIVSFRV